MSTRNPWTFVFLYAVSVVFGAIVSIFLYLLGVWRIIDVVLFSFVLMPIGINLPLFFALSLTYPEHEREGFSPVRVFKVFRWYFVRYPGKINPAIIREKRFSTYSTFHHRDKTFPTIDDACFVVLNQTSDFRLSGRHHASPAISRAHILYRLWRNAQ